MRTMMRRSAANSSGVQAANDFSRRISASEAMSPRRASSSSPRSPFPGSAAGTCSTDWPFALSRMASRSGSGRADPSPRKNRRKTSSYVASCPRPVSIDVRPAQ